MFFSGPFVYEIYRFTGLLRPADGEQPNVLCRRRNAGRNWQSPVWCFRLHHHKGLKDNAGVVQLLRTVQSFVTIDEQLPQSVSLSCWMTVNPLQSTAAATMYR